MRYALQRVLHSVLLLAGISIGSFLLADLAPGDYFSDLRLDPRVTPAILLATPVLLIGIVLLVVAVRTGWLPSGGMRSPGWEGMDAGARLRDTLRHLVIPVAVLVMGMLPVLHRHVRAAVAETLD